MRGALQQCLYLVVLSRWKLVFELTMSMLLFSRVVILVDVLRGRVRNIMLRLVSVLVAALVIMWLVSGARRRRRLTRCAFVDAPVASVLTLTLLWLSSSCRTLFLVQFAYLVIVTPAATCTTTCQRQQAP